MEGTPASVRLAATARPAGYIDPNGVEEYRARVAHGGPSGFVDWRKHPYTSALLRAVDSLVLNPPASLSQEDREVQYGVTQGLVLVRQLVSDPSVLWPGLFGATGPDAGKSVQNGQPPVAGFETPPDAPAAT